MKKPSNSEPALCVGGKGSSANGSILESRVASMLPKGHGRASLAYGCYCNVVEKDDDKMAKHEGLLQDSYSRSLKLRRSITLCRNTGIRRCGGTKPRNNSLTYQTNSPRAHQSRVVSHELPNRETLCDSRDSGSANF